MRKALIRFLCAVMCCSVFSGCASVRRGAAYSVYPVGYLLNRLAGTYVDTVSLQADESVLVQRSVIRDDYADVLASRLAFFHIGNLEPYVQVYGQEIRSSGIAVYDFKRYTPVITDGNVTFVESDYYEDPNFGMVDTDPQDLYLWMDPIAMLSMAKTIHGWLCAEYPELTARFDENLEKLETDLVNLDAQYQSLASSLIKNNQTIRFVTMTAGFGNWQKAYGFQVYPIVLSKYGVLPDEQQLQIIESRILADDVRYIVYEPNMTEEMTLLFNRVEEDLGLMRVELSNLSSLSASEDNDGKDYLSVMYENLSVLETMKSDSEE